MNRLELMKYVRRCVSGRCKDCDKVNVRECAEISREAMLYLADLHGVRTEKWLKRNNRHTCPKCGFYYFADKYFSYCPSCGIFMTGVTVTERASEGEESCSE